MKLGIVPYLNALPLVANVELFIPGATFVEDVPSKLENALQAGQIDLALLSSAYLLNHPETAYIPDLCIASDGAVESVLLYRRKPLTEVRRVCLDADSRTSNVMLRILLEQEVEISPEYATSSAPVDESLEKHDAVLRIGYLREVSHTAKEVDDLGEWWKRAFHKPFVYALWLIRTGRVLSDNEKRLFSGIRDINLECIDKVLETSDYCHRVGLETCRRYVQRCINYNLGPCQLEGLELYLQRARELPPIQ